MGVALGTSLGTFRVPEHLTTHKKFLQWLAETEIPEELRIGFAMGELWVEVMPERAFAHNRIKTALAGVISPIVEAGGMGVYFGDGMLFTSTKAKFSVYPDGMFVSQASIDDGRVWLTGAKEGEEDTELRGSPDLTIEVVSDTSEDKDTEWLMGRYWDAGVQEYWIVDARKEPVKFAIHRRGPKGFSSVRKSGGWTPSPLLARSFRFVPGQMVFGKRQYRFEVAPAAR